MTTGDFMVTTSIALSPRPLRLQRLLSAVLVVTLLASCAPQPPKPSVGDAERGRLGRVGVTQLVTTPECDVDVGQVANRAGGALEGGAKGAAAGGAVGLEAIGSGLANCEGWICGAVILLLPAFIVGGAAIGAVSGAATVAPSAKSTEVESALRKSLNRTGENEALRKEVVYAAHRAGIADVMDISDKVSLTAGQPSDYSDMAKAGIDTIMEVGLVRVDLDGGSDKDPKLRIGEHALVRLIDAKTNTVICEDLHFRHLSEPRRFSEWSADENRALDEELTQGYRMLAAMLVERVFPTKPAK